MLVFTALDASSLGVCDQNAKFYLPLQKPLCGQISDTRANCRKIKTCGRFLRLNLGLKTQNTLLALRYGRLTPF